MVNFSYQYNFCWFDEVKQDHTSLGKFGNSIWDVKGSVMVYSGGSACWNGPERATFVHLICGEKTEIISVEEPDKCQYLMKINTPVVCEIEKADREDFKEHDQFHSEL